MRSIGLSRLLRSIKFRRELRLETAAGLFELRFGPGHVSQQCMKLLRTQYQQSKHKYEQDFRADTHDSPLGDALVVRNGSG
jgi:hypothetical protein